MSLTPNSHKLICDRDFPQRTANENRVRFENFSPKRRAPKLRVPKVRVPKVRVLKVRVLKLRVLKLRALKVRVPKVRVPKVRALKRIPGNTKYHRIRKTI